MYPRQSVHPVRIIPTLPTYENLDERGQGNQNNILVVDSTFSNSDEGRQSQQTENDFYIRNIYGDGDEEDVLALGGGRERLGTDEDRWVGGQILGNGLRGRLLGVV